MTILALFLLPLLALLALTAIAAARLAASPLFRCLSLCFASWAEASRGEPGAPAAAPPLGSTRA